MTVRNFVLFLCLCCFVGAIESDSIVNLSRYGSLRGSIAKTSWTNRTFTQFLGVQYAESPSGNRRFKAPVPVKPWIGIRDALNFGQKCPVIDDLLKMSEMERNSVDLENCLNMAIYSPELSGSFPVMFFVHGGGFHLHSAAEYPPNYLLERDIVLVVVQYRLDALGFLSTNSNEIPGNVGLLDVILALNFVKENIAQFGGNPNSVTLFGQSSGASMISALAISPTVPKNLFHGVIVQSGSIFSTWSFTTDPVKDAKDIAVAAGLNSNQSIAFVNEAFMKMSVFELLSAVDRYQKDFASGLLKPGARSISIGGPTNLLPDTPQKLVSSSHHYTNTIPMIIGTTKDDGTYAATVTYDYLQSYNQTVDRANGNISIVNVVLDLMCYLLSAGDSCTTSQSVYSSTFWTNDEITRNELGELLPGLIDLLGTLFFKAPAFELALSNAKSSNTFLYTFDYQGKNTRFGYGADTSHYPFEGGVTHSDDLIYLFPYPLDIVDLSVVDIQAAQNLLDLWTSFAANNRPQSRSDEKFSWLPLVPGKLGPYAFIDTKLKTGRDYAKELLRNVSERREIDSSQLIALLFEHLNK